MMKNVALELKDVFFYREKQRILGPIDLKIPKGEFTGLIGPNGAGKTTLLRCLDGILDFQGEIKVLDNDLKSLNELEIAKYISFMKQETKASFPLSVLETVLLGRYPHLNWYKKNTDADRQMALKYLDLVKLSDKTKRMLNELSGGERQRVMFAKCLTQETPIILLDEPSSSLDIMHQEDIFIYSSEYCKQGGTIVAAIHDLTMAAKYCTNLILLVNGNVLAAGDVETVFTEENLKEAYDEDVSAYYNRITGQWDVALFKKSERRNTRIHIIGGGGKAAATLKILKKQGYKLSIGVLEKGDIDEQCADFFHVPKIVNPPFNLIEDEKIEENRKKIEQSDFTILCPIDFGECNLGNLLSLNNYERVIILDDMPIENRDFTNNKRASRIYNEIKRKAIVLTSDELMDYLEQKFNG